MRDACDLINQAVTFRDLELDIEIDVNILVYSFSESKFLALSRRKFVPCICYGVLGFSKALFSVKCFI